MQTETAVTTVTTNAEAVLIAALNDIQARIFWSKSTIKGIQNECRKAMESLDEVEKTVNNAKKKIVYVVYNNKAELERLEA